MNGGCTYIPNSWNGPCGRKLVPGTERCDLHQSDDYCRPCEHDNHQLCWKGWCCCAHPSPSPMSSDTHWACHEQLQKFGSETPCCECTNHACVKEANNDKPEIHPASSEKEAEVSNNLDDILRARGRYSAEVERGEGVLHGLTNFEAKQQIQALMLDLIGEDDVTNGAFADINEKAEHLNELRRELRRKVEAL